MMHRRDYLTNALQVLRFSVVLVVLSATPLIVGCESVNKVGKCVGDALVGAVEAVGRAGKDIVTFPQEVAEYDQERTEVARLRQEREQLKEQIQNKENPPPDPRTELPKIKTGSW